MNLILSIWAEKHSFNQPFKLGGNKHFIYLVKRYSIYEMITLIVNVDDYTIMAIYDNHMEDVIKYRKDLQATLQCGLPVFIGF